MGQGKLDQGMVNTPVGIGDVEPGYCQRAFAPFSCLDDGCQLSLVLRDSRDGRQECLLQIGV